MTGLSLILQCLLAGVLCVIAVLSIQLVVLGYFRLFKPAPRVRLPLLPDEALPRVLVQLPVCDEGPLAVRVAAAAARLDWPRDKLEIQVLDDGRTGDPEDLVRAIVSVVPDGVSLKVLRRGERAGFKAGNLAFGLKHSDAPYVAIFDADFVPPTDFLRRTVPVLVADQGLAYAQARWGHANRTKNWLTRAQGMLLDAHFAVEQEGRFRAGLPMSFNGTAGVWSRAAIDSGGGWTGDTLTEDLDLSMRCAMKGWRTVMLSDIEVPGELPETAAAWRAQQARWTKGHAQTARKLLPLIWASTMPLWKKAAMSLQMCQFAFYTLAFFSAAISLTLMYMDVVYFMSVSLLGLSVSALGLVASAGYLYLGQAMLGRERLPCIARSIALALVFPSGLVLANTRATFEAFFSSHMHFHRTLRPGERYAGGWRGGPELVIGLLLPIFAFAEQAWSAPFFFFAVTGLVSIGAMGLTGSATALPRPEIRPGE
ncbi:MAG TPA: glycosyltransferase family 2 protein [Rhizomicrobium sp.]|jgi:cellulose synthase/poly-beta-1,6-N-acetylglucosamine synthase-like glycosyltransferase|nr:glycosyltransferase family 2 protein [Rhizomicrobium sp.]